MPVSQPVTDACGISVAMAAYNAAVYLPAQLDSIARQTLLPTELVVCDNASTDDTIPVLEAFAHRAPFPVHIHRNLSNLGVLNNFKRAFSLCSNPFIAYCDADDVWAPEKLAKCFAALRQPGVVLVSHNSRLTDSELRPFGIVIPDSLDPGRYSFPHFPLRYWGFGHQMVFSRELLSIMNRLYSTAPASSVPINSLDQLIPLAAGMLGDTIYIREALVDFRRHNQAVTFVHTQQYQQPSLKTSAMSSLVKKRLVLAQQRETILALRDWLVSESWEGSSNGGRRARYAAHLEKTLRALEARVAIHQNADLLSRTRAFMTALSSRAYRDARKGGPGRHQILIDLFALLKPVREPGQPQP